MQPRSFNKKVRHSHISYISMKQNSIIRNTALAGIFGSALFVMVFTIEGWLRPGYDACSMYVSALSLGPRGVVQITNFIVSGLLMLIFGRGLAIAFRKANTSQAGPVLLTIVAAGMFLSGPFVMDPAGTPPAQATVHGLVHGIVGSVVFVLMPISVLVCYRRLRSEPGWRTFSRWTLAAGVILTTTLAFFISATKVPMWHIIGSEWYGVLQRLVLIPFMFWVFTLGIALYVKRA